DRAVVAGAAQRERAVTAAGGRRAGDRQADAVVAVDEEGELADVVDRLLVAEPPLERVVDRSEHTLGSGVRAVERPLVGVALTGVLERGEEPEAILDDVAAEGRADVADVRQLRLRLDARSCRGDRARRSGQATRGERSEDRSVELVTTGLGDRADR